MRRIYLTYLFVFMANLVVPGQSAIADSLEQILSKTNNDSQKVDILLQLAKMTYGYTDKPVAYVNHAIKLSQKIGYAAGEGAAYNQIAWNHFVRQQIDSANLFVDKAYAVYKKEDLKSGLARCHNIRAVLLAGFQSVDEAIEEYQTAYNLYGEAGDKGGQMAVMNNLGVFYNDSGRFKEGMECHLKNIEYYLVNGDKVALSRAYLNYSHSLAGLKEWDEAAKQCIKSYVLRRESSYVSGMSESLAHLGDIVFSARKETAGPDTLFRSYLKSLGFRDAFEALDTAYVIAKRLKAMGLYQVITQTLIKGYLLDRNFEAAYHLSEHFHAVQDSFKLNEGNLSAFNTLQTQLQSEQQKNRILELEKEALQKEQHLRGRNLLTGIVLGLLVVSASFLYAFRQKLKSRTLEIELKNKQLKELEKHQQIMAMNAMLAGQENERERISKDLHDGLGNLLSTVKLHINHISKEINQLKNLDLYHDVNQLIDEACTEVRKIAHDMMPVSLQKLGLQRGLEELVRKQNQTNGVHIHFQYFGDEARLETSKEIMLYRICQELLNNIHKHASATEVIVQLSKTDGRLYLTVEDDGVGFDLEAAKQKKTLGLRSIQSRIQFLDGQLDIDSRKGEGTTVNIEVPVKGPGARGIGPLEVKCCSPTF